MRFALAQVNPTTLDLYNNAEMVERNIELAREQEADVVIFPETVITGYCHQDKIEEREILEVNKELLLGGIARRTKGIAAVVGFVDFDPSKKNEDGRIRKYNAAAVLSDGGLAGVAHKTLLANYGVFDDKRHYHPGEFSRPIPVNTREGRLSIGPSICEMMFDEAYQGKPIPDLARQGADIIININASPFNPGKFLRRQGLIRGHIRNTGLPFIYVNTVGIGDINKNIIPFDGDSLFYDSAGNLIARAGQFKDQLMIVDLDMNTKVGRQIEVPDTPVEKEIYGALVMGLREYAQEAASKPFSRVINPVSGGIDSALGSCLAVDAFGPGNVTFYNLPSKFNKESTRASAEKLARNLGVEYRVWPIQKITDTIVEEYESHHGSAPSKKNIGNVQARVRGLLMMLVSNELGPMLISNGNETEVGLGYATLYGDMCGGLSVIGDVPKTDVYSICRFINQSKGREIIPQGIFDEIPSAELEEGQFDPFDYSVDAPIVGEIAKKRCSVADIVDLYERRALDPESFRPDGNGLTAYQKYDTKAFADRVQSIYNTLSNTVYKRCQGAPIIAIREGSFGFGFREPLINKWRGRR